VQVSIARKNGSFDFVTAASFFATFGWAMFMHIIFWLINLAFVNPPKKGVLRVTLSRTRASMLLRLSVPTRRAVIIMASQKTLPVALNVVGFLPESSGDKGLLSIACVIGHIAQV
jgi:hypothetical protein